MVVFLSLLLAHLSELSSASEGGTTAVPGAWGAGVGCGCGLYSCNWRLRKFGASGVLLVSYFRGFSQGPALVLSSVFSSHVCLPTHAATFWWNATGKGLERFRLEYLPYT